MKDRKPGITRRQLAASAAAFVPAAAASAQEVPKPTDDLASAREQAKRTSAALRKFKLGTLVEPSFVFEP